MKKEQKVNRNRRPLSIIDKSAFVCLVVLVIYLGIALPIHYQYSVFSWHWFIFGLVALTIPFAFINFQVMWQKKVPLSEGQKKNPSAVTIKYIIYFWLLDCFYMAIFNQWTVWIYIIGIVTLIKVFYSLTVAFLGKKQRSVFMDINLLFDFLLGIGLTIYLIYLIPDKFNNLQTIITSIIAAIYGGLLTLIGVAWTIKHSENRRTEDERRKSEPLFSYVYKKMEPSKRIVITEDNFIFMENKRDSSKVQEGILIYAFAIENSSKIEFFVFGLIINGGLYELKTKELVRKDYGVIFNNLNIPLQCITEIKLYVEDVLGNFYTMQLIFSNNDGKIQIKGNKPIQYMGDNQ